MIEQRINLYDDRFREKRIILSAVDMLLVTVIAVGLLLTTSYWYHLLVTHAEQEQLRLTSQKEQLTVTLQELRKALETRLSDNRIEIQVKKVSREITLRKRLIDMVVSKQFGSGMGFSEQLSELSRFRVNNVWLNEISLSESDLRLSGSALKAESIPEYFNEFQQRDLFSGRTFEVFEVNRDQQQNWKVDFLIASRANY
ncbi:MAG: PilN domain-containing protein [Gammaproteobacteria bacterium]|nr:PilN domain-containing protein [Gammaproteobacteria bacterium]